MLAHLTRYKQQSPDGMRRPLDSYVIRLRDFETRLTRDEVTVPDRFETSLRDDVSHASQYITWSLEIGIAKFKL